MTPAIELDAVVVGAGVIGLAVGRQLALGGREVVLLEQEPVIGHHTSSRNSEVIHAGIYYPTGSAKAALCVRGKRLLYEFLEVRGIAHRRVGKIIVAARDEDTATLQAIQKQAEANGVLDLSWLDQRQVRELEPAVRCRVGLLSPSTGIVDSHEFMAALRRDIESSSGHVVTSAPLLSARVRDGGFELEVGGSEPFSARCRTLVNAAGLVAQAVAARIAGVPEATIPPCHYAKGHYFVLSGKAPFARLVYPVPEPGGLGVHVTLDLAGRARFGPDVSYVEGIDYTFDEARKPAFCEAIRRYYPDLDDERLEPGYTGIRPKLGPAGSPAQDFVIAGPEAHGVANLVQLFGIESPGLTASLAIAERVAALLGEPDEARIR